ncbi:hypothetical protein RF11_01112 [Thelohanellus kitauei]|uniref:Uncharacterized protein n=1 Tax=Thelohanellus kitauei TaxID=669202 RepID=A0A0C2J366_THEKT|nr:hypothetical protein RF11_01112 [Thelohanellus kitauei]
MWWTTPESLPISIDAAILECIQVPAIKSRNAGKATRSVSCVELSPDVETLNALYTNFGNLNLRDNISLSMGALFAATWAAEWDTLEFIIDRISSIITYLATFHNLVDH